MQIYDTVIIGGGPAGLSAGIYVARAGLQAILLEKTLLGGQAITTDTIENYPGFPEPVSGLEMINRMEEQVRKYHLSIEQKEVKAINYQQDESIYQLQLAEEEMLASHTVIIATGASPIPLAVPGEQRYRGRGVSYCATCDGPLFRNKVIAVVGGGNSALEECLFLTRFAETVYLIHRREAFRGDKILQERVLHHPKIRLVLNSIVKEILGDSLIRELVVESTKDQAITSLKVDGLFVYVGTKPNTGWLIPMLKSDEQGFLITDEGMATNLPGLFAAGDCRQKTLRQIITAASDGALAGMTAYRYLQEKKLDN